MDKKSYQDNWKEDWLRQRKEGEGLGGLFQRFVRSAQPEWIEHWEKMMYDVAGFAYDTAHELTDIQSDKKRSEEFKAKLAKMTQDINSNVRKPGNNKPAEDQEE